MQLLPPLKFRFHEDDRETYGSDWCVYDESAVTRIPVRELVQIESTVGMSVLTMLRRARENYADANLAATWVARKLAGIEEDFEKYEPLVILIDWQLGDADPPEETRSTSSSAE